MNKTELKEGFARWVDKHKSGTKVEAEWGIYCSEIITSLEETIVSLKEKIFKLEEDKVISELLLTLKPCPFCGSRDLKIISIKSEDEPNFVYAKAVHCKDCCCTGKHNTRIGWTETNQAAAEQWNKRI